MTTRLNPSAPRATATGAGLLLLYATSLCATVPGYSLANGVVRIAGVGPDNPILYDNDWWTDVPDAAYLWAKASLGEANLVGNVVTRCTFGWETKYAHELKQQTEEAARLFRLARESGLRNIPQPVAGSTVALRKPAGGKVADTQFERTAGSALILAEAKKASPEKPLLVFVGGSCTTVASAFLADPSITNRVIVFQVDGGGYNGSDGWAWEITMRHFKFVNWARDYFWDQVGVWKPERFNTLPRNPLDDFLREYSVSGLGKANQWGDGAWLLQLFAPGCVTTVEDYDGLGITVPRVANDLTAMENEFFRTLTNPAVYQAPRASVDSYRIQHIQGWEVRVNRKLETDDAKALNQALALMEAQLQAIVERVPAPAVARLREVPLWVSPEYPGIAPKAEYHPDAGWLREHGRDPAMAKAVEFTNVRIFEAECRRMPMLVLHELAHAYHDRVLGHQHAGIKAAFDHARASGKYDRVERQDSKGQRSFDRAYALTNPEEYFAETTEAYFGVNDFFPFNREELKEHDPGMFELLTRIWNAGGTTE